MFRLIREESNKTNIVYSHVSESTVKGYLNLVVLRNKEFRSCLVLSDNTIEAETFTGLKINYKIMLDK